MTLASGDLTTLEPVKQWLSIETDDSDSIISRLISSASRFILGYIHLSSVAVQQYDENYDGYGQNFMLLKKWPAISVQRISFAGLTITSPATGNPRSNGFLLSAADDINMGPQRLMLFGHRFPCGRGLVDVLYTAGFGKFDDPFTVPATPHLIAPSPAWAGDLGVKYANGSAFTKVTSAPAVGQYSVNEATGVYTFAAADEGEAVLLSYSFVPADLEQACIELVGEGVRYMDRMGIKSKTLGGQETVVYDNSFMSDRISSLLRSFIRVSPI